MSGKTKPSIQASTINSSIIGTYEGEALDSMITNKNGLDITTEVMQTVLESEEYKEGIEYGWFIGFLGHPEDPACQEFENGCIVLTDMWIEDNGKVYAKFNLIDTPVGQIVKKFIDAGVRFGISIRGAGDIVGNSVDPETFMFRGYDLVAFPAYPESIPEFKEIAASTDLADRKKYQSVCAAVRDNLSAITSSTAIDILQQQFAPQSAEFAALEARKEAINASAIDLSGERIEAMTCAYIECLSENKALKSDLEKTKQSKRTIESAYRRKFNAIQRITTAQIDDVLASLDEAEDAKSIMAARTKRMSADIKKLNNEVEGLKKANLIYKQRITASNHNHAEQQSTIKDLKSRLRETVTASREVRSQTSNLDAENQRLSDELIECQQQLAAFQTAYAKMYANALGVNSMNIQVSPQTSVAEIHSLVEASMNTCNIAAQPVVDDFYLTDAVDDDNEIISI